MSIFPTSPHMPPAGRVLHLPLAALLVGLGLFAVACDGCDDAQGDIRAGEAPQLEVDPTTVVFASATTERPETQTILVTNAGTGTLRLDPSTLEPARGPFTFVDAEVKALGPGEVTSLTVTYAPVSDATPAGRLTVRATDGQTQVVNLTTVAPNRELQCEPSPINFGATTIGETEQLDVVVTNIGSLPVTLTEIGLEFGDIVQVSDAPELDLELRPAQSTTVTLSVTPQLGGNIEDTLLLEIAEGEGFTCAIRANVPVPLLDLAPTRVDFGTVAVGQTVTEDITVRNVGTATLSLDAVELLRGTSPDFAVVNPPAEPVELEPEATTVVTLSYTAGADTATGTAVFFSNDPTAPQASVALLGRPSRPEIGVTPESVDFGNVGQGVTTSRIVTIFNNGTEALLVDGLSLDTISAEFAITADPAFAPTTGAQGTLEPGQSVDVRITYGPTNLGRDGGDLVIPSNDPNRPQVRVRLDANGLDRAECEVVIRPEPANFGLVARGSFKELPVNIQNTGSGYCTYNGAQARGTFNTAYTVTGASLGNGQQFGPGEVMSVNVKYTPNPFDALGGTDIFPVNGSLSVNITDPLNGNQAETCGICRRPNPPFECNFITPPLQCGTLLTGTTGVADIAVIPGNVDFGLVTLGCASQTIDVTIYNTGTAGLQIRDVRLDGCSPEFELRGTPGPPYPVEVTSAAPVPIQVVYRPTARGVDQCELVITSDVGGGTDLRVPLRGEGTTVSHQVDTFEQLDGRKVDALFVIDGSGSMQAEADKVASNLQRFFSAAELLSNDFHVGIVHLDVGEELNIDGTRYAAGRLIGDPPFLTGSTPNYLSEFADRVSNIVVGGGTQEAGLEAARIALSDPFITETSQACGGCQEPYNLCTINGVCGGFNGGFLRQDASLEIIILSDEEDQSRAQPDFYVDFFRSIKGFRNDSLLNISVIIGANTSNNRPADCTAGNDGADGGYRYGEVADATGGTIGSICAADYGPFLQNVGNRAFGLQREFFLSRVAEPATVVVRVDGTPRSTGWTYDANTNSVIFERDAIPQAGSEIEVEYDAFCFP